MGHLAPLADHAHGPRTGTICHGRPEPMKTRILGGDLEVSELGYGAMGLAGTYGDVGEQQGLTALTTALDHGISLIDTSDAYGGGSNERLVGRAIAGRRDGVVVATKWGVAPGENSSPAGVNWDLRIPIDARPERARQAAEASLERLGIEVIDLWYLHYPDPVREIEDVVGAMAELVRSGHVLRLGLSNVTADQLRRAHAIHPITAIQFEYSLWSRGIERELLPAARELGVGLVAWGPLGSGFLAGSVGLDGSHNYRTHSPRFAEANLARNVERFEPCRALAARLGLTPAQLALAWLLHRGADIVPIPGTRSPEHLEANLAACEIELDDATLEELERLAPPGLPAGEQLVA